MRSSACLIPLGKDACIECHKPEKLEPNHFATVELMYHFAPKVTICCDHVVVLVDIKSRVNSCLLQLHPKKKALRLTSNIFRGSKDIVNKTSPYSKSRDTHYSHHIRLLESSHHESFYPLFYFVLPTILQFQSYEKSSPNSSTNATNTS